MPVSCVICTRKNTDNKHLAGRRHYAVVCGQSFATAAGGGVAPFPVPSSCLAPRSSIGIIFWRLPNSIVHQRIRTRLRGWPVAVVRVSGARLGRQIFPASLLMMSSHFRPCVGRARCAGVRIKRHAIFMSDKAACRVMVIARMA